MSPESLQVEIRENVGSIRSVVLESLKKSFQVFKHAPKDCSHVSTPFLCFSIGIKLKSVCWLYWMIKCDVSPVMVRVIHTENFAFSIHTLVVFFNFNVYGLGMCFTFGHCLFIECSAFYVAKNKKLDLEHLLLKTVCHFFEKENLCTHASSFHGCKMDILNL